MELPQIIQAWDSERKDKQAAVDWWDSMSERFGERPIPSFADNEFLQLLEREKMLSADAEVLDVGCGTGGHDLAIAARAKSVVGVDLSPRMIEAANRRAGELLRENVRFVVGDWHEFDVEKEGFKAKFDLVFAHMTPALQGYETFRKFAECSRKWCVMVKPIKRIDVVHDAILDLLGITGKMQMGDSDVINAFALLFADERYPRIEYNRRSNESKYPVDKAISVFTNRTKSAHSLTAQQEELIRDYLHSIAEDGKVTTFMDTTTATLYWHV